MRIDPVVHEILNKFYEGRADGAHPQNHAAAGRAGGANAAGRNAGAASARHDANQALLNKLPPDLHNAAKAILAYQSPVTSESLDRILSYIQPHSGLNLESAALLVTGGVDAAFSDIGLLSDIINGRFNVSDELLNLINLYIQAADKDGTDILRDAAAIRAVLDAIFTQGGPGLSGNYGDNTAGGDSTAGGASAGGAAGAEGGTGGVQGGVMPQAGLFQQIIIEAIIASMNAGHTGQAALPGAIPTNDALAYILNALLEAGGGAAGDGGAASENALIGNAAGAGDSSGAAANIPSPLPGTAQPAAELILPAQIAQALPAQTAPWTGSAPQGAGPADTAQGGGQPGEGQTVQAAIIQPPGTYPAATQADNAEAFGMFLRQVIDGLSEHAPGLLDYIDSNAGGGIEKFIEAIRMAALGLYGQTAGGGQGAAGPRTHIPGDGDGAPGDAVRGYLLGGMLKEPGVLPERLLSGNGEIKAHYEYLLVHINLLRASLRRHQQQSPEKEAAMRQIESIEDAFRLINSLNSRHQYVQIPMHFAGQDSNLELFVMKRGGGKKKIDHEDATLFISLNTQNIGKVEALIHTGKNKNVSIDMRAENEGILSLMRESRMDLHNALADRGYKLARATYRVIEGRVTAANAAAQLNELFPHDQSHIDYRI